MFFLRAEPGRRALPLSLCHILCLCATWIPSTYGASLTAENLALGLHLDEGFGLIPSAQAPTTTASAPLQSHNDPAGLASSASLPPEPVLSSPPQSDQQLLSSASVPSESASPGQISIAPIPSAISPSGFPPIGSAPVAPDATSVPKPSAGNVTGTPVMQSTDQGLKPIPPAATQIGDPDGHHEITEPNFSATKSCRGCSPVFEITATGWIDNPPEEQHASTTEPVIATVTAGPSSLLVSQESAGGNFIVGGSVTVAPGETVTINNLPLAVQTTAGTFEVVIGTTVIPLLQPENKSWKGSHTTRTPTQLPPVLTIGSETLVANPLTQYIVSGQTLAPGGAAITISGTTISLAPSATAVVVNGATSTVTPNFGNIWTTAAPALTLNDVIYPANRAGYITISPGTVLKPGGDAITVNGTTLSLDTSGTAVVIQGSTSLLKPITTVVTLTKSVGLAGIGGGSAGFTSGGSWVSPTGRPQIPAKPVSAGGMLRPGYTTEDGWLGGLLLFVWWGLGYLAVSL